MRASAAYNHRFQDQSCYICNEPWPSSLLKKVIHGLFQPAIGTEHPCGVYQAAFQQPASIN